MKNFKGINLNPAILKVLLYCYLFVILVVAVFPISSTGMRSINTVYVVSFRLDHLLHLAIFTPMFPILHLNGNYIRTRNIILILAISIALAVWAELVQYFIWWRTFNPADLISNFVGALIGFFLWWPVHRYFMSLKN